jgi:CTP:molybdopterin cytidylyltransferase MocA
MRVAGLLLAAGGGSRFGGPKALVRFGDEPATTASDDP